MKHYPDNKKHLGGHANTTHVDRGALEYCKQHYPNLTTLTDIGCGPGGHVDLARHLGYDAMGIDGDTRLKHPHIIAHDYTTGSPPIDSRHIAWSCEFLEHVEEAYQANYMATFCEHELVIVTYAPPGTPGHHHVNCRTEDYWKDTFIDYGLLYNDKHTQGIRQASTMRRDFLRHTGLVFNNIG